MEPLIVIPARLESSRLTRKMLLAETGKPLIQHTYEAAAKSGLPVMVATDSSEIFDVVLKFGGTVVQTDKHDTGTDRIASIMDRVSHDYIINVQGDEPEISPETIKSLAEFGVGRQISTLITPANLRDLPNPSYVKVAVSGDRAFYFSRSPIPFGYGKHYRHVGTYCYHRDFLKKLTDTPQTELELQENLEQLRALEFGPISVLCVEDHPPGIDTYKDYCDFRDRYNSC